MNQQVNWQEANANYLSTVLLRLRSRLEQQAGIHIHASPIDGRSSTSASPDAIGRRMAGKPWGFNLQRKLHRVLGFLRRSPSQRGHHQYPTEVVHQPETERKPIADQTKLLAFDEAINPPPALLILAQQLGLTDFEQEILVLCAGMEFDTGLASLYAKALGDPTRPYPSFALALAVLDEPAWNALSTERPLRYWRLLEINQPGGQSLITSALRADERIVNYLKGLNNLDDRLAPLLTPLEIPTDDESLAPSQQVTLETITGQLHQAGTGGQGLPVIQLLGSDGPSKRFLAGHIGKSLGLVVHGLAVDLLPTQAAELEYLARLWRRERQLLPLALYLDAHDRSTAPPSGAQAGTVSRFLELTQGVVFLDTQSTWPLASKKSLQVDVAKPTAAEQQDAWSRALDQAAGSSPAQLAGQFTLSLPSIRSITAAALAETASHDDSLHQRLWASCLATTRPRLENLAVRLEPKAGWDDMVLPAREYNLLRQIAAQVKHRSHVYDDWGFRDKISRGLSINALFAGPSGAGKTMAAEVIANALHLNLYRIDLSSVVSKYIGETEKNLRRLFDAAEDGGAILFFDEADALFGKRSEVKDSHDRYANIEINYLLQRLESFHGLAILATNMKSALDEAFMRRLRFIVNFPHPGVEERQVIWKKIFPLQTPTVDLEFDRLARLQLTGGEIRNIALNAAFLAADSQTEITMPLVLESAREEFRKLDRPINEADFRWSAVTEVVA